MKCRLIIGVFVLCISALMLMSNAMASGWPVAWANQTTLSSGSDCQDPENSGCLSTQAVVWEEDNGANWDIMMAYSLLDGIPGSWIMSPVPPAASDADELNPAVAVSRPHPSTSIEIHVVYQKDIGGGTYEIYHTYTLNFGVIWSAPVLLSTPNCDALDPAIVYTEDLWMPGPGVPSMLMQMV